MRLEKILYEKALNRKIFNRSRDITRPSMLYYDTNVLGGSCPQTPLDKYFWDPIRKVINRLEWWYLDSRTEQIGISIEDLTVIKGPEIRRDVLMEHVFRESTHPMTRELIRLRGLAHEKVELSVRGFEAPDYLKKDNRCRTLLEGLGNFLNFRHFYWHNYLNDQTVFNHQFTGICSILDAGLVRNSVELNTFSRYFYNEKQHYSIDDYLEETRRERNLKLSDPADFEEFFQRCVERNSSYPGFYAMPGEEPTRENIKKALDNIILQTGWTDLTSDDLTDLGSVSRYHKSPWIAPSYPTEDVKPGTNNIGLDLPAYLKRERTSHCLFSLSGFEVI